MKMNANMRNTLGKCAVTWFYAGLGAFCALAVTGLWHAAVIAGVVWLLVLIVAGTLALIVAVWRQ